MYQNWLILTESVRSSNFPPNQEVTKAYINSIILDVFPSNKIVPH